MRGRAGRHGACRKEREGARNKWVRREMGRKRSKGISKARAIPSKKVTGRAGEGDRHAPEGA